MAADGPLNVVALVSGGKDSFYSILHCLANGHRVLALANLHPPPSAAKATASTTASRAEADHTRGGPGGQAVTSSAGTTRIPPGIEAAPLPEQHEFNPSSDTRGGASDYGGGGESSEERDEETDLNSFMYQTVGHQVIPLYARATGLPLFRQPILGTAVDHGVSYRDPDDDDDRHHHHQEEEHEEEDETESLVPLLRAVLDAHPEVNALCTGAILSTYQRTRVESVALRLGLVPLAYLWQFPELPLSSIATTTTTTAAFSSSISSSATTTTTTPRVGSVGDKKDDAQLLRDMAAAGLEARVVKVASAGLGEEFLWENVASEGGVSRIRRALRRFGGGGGRGSVLGEGGEFETLVVDGPPALFRGRIVVRDDDRRVVREGGGSAWLSIREATVEMKRDGDVDAAARTGGSDLGVRVPGLLDSKFETVFESLKSNVDELGYEHTGLPQTSTSLPSFKPISSDSACQDWYFIGSSESAVDRQTESIVSQVRERLHKHSLSETAITNSIIVLRRMADFPTINKLYGALFKEPNPPARVTISCGELLPAGGDITMLLSVQFRMKQGDRRGLHVQSRSYWAPANIGPYSQAITYPLLSNEDPSADSDSPLAVSIAGQIPLIPASMTLPLLTPDSGGAELQIVLALQHLWRVGAEMQVRWWSSAVAYFARPLDSPFGGAQARRSAGLAATAWKAAHSRPLANTKEEVGPDLWDRKYNPMYMTYGDGDDATEPTLPDWEVLKDFDDGGDDDNEEMQERPVPYVFSAEVEELPRSAGVEWHAHLGFANVGSGSVRLYSEPGAPDGLPGDPDLHHVIVEHTNGDAFVQTVVVYRKAETTPNRFSFVEAVDGATLALRKSLARLLMGAENDASPQHEVDDTIIKAKLSYVDKEHIDTPTGGAGMVEKGAVIACGSLWDSQMRRLDMVSIFETRWARVR
ncbi:adenine nucleotide alpha hydrolases-like protein [Hypoxylon rubiginosum]|uniref:Adenine nucleotide alpha hydrolases-like protein n=1 Tax=Hypoxylon rubiginosum TaxID=110542 RepID=A0ACB9YQT0_9PEZI|nr:adenine nucleotide alpha hydrolases-like protein [Hypoxylon rubiginosum]